FEVWPPSNLPYTPQDARSLNWVSCTLSLALYQRSIAPLLVLGSSPALLMVANAISFIGLVPSILMPFQEPGVLDTPLIVMGLAAFPTIFNPPVSRIFISVPGDISMVTPGSMVNSPLALTALVPVLSTR